MKNFDFENFIENKVAVHCVCNELGADKIIALDKNAALEKVCAGGVVTEYDKLIDRQLERATVTTIAGFSKIFPDACKFVEFGE